MPPETVEETLRALRAEGRLDEVATLLVRRFGAELFGFLRASLGSPSDADDVFSQLTEDLWRGLPGFRGDASYRTWLYVLARNAAHRHRRDPLRKRGVSASEAGLSNLEAVSREVTRTFDRTDVKTAIAELRDALDPDDKMLLVLRVERRMPFRDIARVFAADAPTDPKELARLEASLRKRYERAKTTLRAKAESAGLVRAKSSVR